MGYQFKNPDLLHRALIHASTGDDDNEELEFFGDSVLGYVVANVLVGRLSGKSVGELSVLKSNLISNQHLSEVASKLGIDRQLIMGPSVKDDSARSTRVCADAVEAVIGAITQDGGVGAAQRFIEKHVVGVPLEGFKSTRHPKSLLQEWAAARGLPNPSYEVTEYVAGSPKEIWRVRCAIDGTGKSAMGLGESKKLAERYAAANLHAKLN